MKPPPSRILGAILAGGRSVRFGSDKGAALWQGQSLLDHVRMALAAQCDDIVVCAGENRALGDGLPLLADHPEPDLGPLGGLCAALIHARASGFDAVLTAPVDALPVPDNLLGLLAGEGAAVVESHWLFGLWPSDLAPFLEPHLRAGKRSVLSWVEACSARQVRLPGPPPLNVNTPAILAALEQGSALGGAVEVHAMRELDFATLAVREIARIVPVETPVAIEFNGIGYAVMMATPTDLEDFVSGFALSEGLARPQEIEALHLHQTCGGWVARANLPARSLPRLLERARTRVSESSCGICGIDSIAAALAPLDPVEAEPLRLAPAAIHKALTVLRDHQRVGAATGAAHAAAFCSPDGDIILLREDVGRHNALDKLVGAMGRQNIDRRAGFALLSARCSQELVEKTVRAGIPVLITISAPSSLAIARAREGRLTLLALARNDSVLVVNDPHGVFD
ncbi:formate dehydrogenase accessory sulfurtransferase FdhD [Porphyrobacter sp. AAP60]|uniref:formate dehydrogenase accessory sulfurtransferase FdhD n=1 Tax=Porphyrobacter sp. AAP60 TaxID=1523423 RepID=UPI0009E7CB54|nr:formate dehydrogenase accessory sulfurtransferase FdhD [Porphyrobacter sp. AAP60]